MSLWRDAILDDTQQQSKARRKSLSQLNAKRVLFLAKEGRFRDVIKSLTSHGYAEGDAKALQKLHQRHPTHQLPAWIYSQPPSLCANSDLVFQALKKFTRASSSRYSQHLLDAILGTAAGLS